MPGVLKLATSWGNGRRRQNESPQALSSAVFPYPVTGFTPGNFVSQLKYVDPVSPTFQPFHFPRLSVTLSVQAGFGLLSAFHDLDGSIMIHPLWTPHVRELVNGTQDILTRYRMERTLFRPNQALSFQISLVDEVTGSWIEPCSVGAPCECSAYNGMTAGHISCSRVQALLDHLQEQENAMEADAIEADAKGTGTETEVDVEAGLR